MSFKEDYMDNCLKFEKIFDKMCEIGAPVLGKLTQCAVIEVDDSGYLSIAANRSDFASFFLENNIHKAHPNLTYNANRKEEFVPACSVEFLQLIWNKGGLLHDSEFDLNHSFYYREKINGGKAHRLYCFCSDSVRIYNELINNLTNVKKFIRFFAEENKIIFDSFKDNKLNIANERLDYFEAPANNHTQKLSEKDRTIALLRTINKLDLSIDISDREWQCLKLCTQGKSANQTGDILSISRRTVETHLSNLKQKLNIRTKSELVDTFN